MRKISKYQNNRRVIVKKPELLAPAGNLEKLKVAILYGADAVFVGGKEFSLRSNASNFSLEDIREGVEFARKHGADIHVTCNIILHDDNLEGIEEYLCALDNIGVKAIIVADPYIMHVAKSLHLKLEVHVSTQLSSLNSEAIDFFVAMGMDRVVLGREVSYEDLVVIRNNNAVDIEYFIHGAMCVHYSGRCMLSNYFSHRDANRGGCSQSCRWDYDLYQDSQLVNDKENKFSMSSKDMALGLNITSLIELGIDSFKIEGRMKSLHYVATVVSTYRKLIDTYCQDPDGFINSDFYKKELLKAANRAVCDGFYYDKMDQDSQLFSSRQEHPTQEFVMRVLDYDKTTKRALIEQRNYFKVGERIEIFSPRHDNIEFVVTKIYNELQEEVDVANHPMELLYIDMDHEVMFNDMGRKVV
ncbi:peptidase U32 family protein [Tannockella kyphosi]|uniref:peptidase U32 family protein n=1 Tax=Tannockella kyphosi TaxID=2899121 RepID=UPI002010F607|nr:U32 family peptidase [Tannockella kyphosi]